MSDRPTLDEAMEAAGLKPTSDAPSVTYEGPSLPPGVSLTMGGRPGEPLTVTIYQESYFFTEGSDSAHVYTTDAPTPEEMAAAIANAARRIREFRDDERQPGPFIAISPHQSPMAFDFTIGSTAGNRFDIDYPRFVDPPSAGRPILEAHYREHLDCDELCRNAWARMVGRVPSEAVLAYLENRPGCLIGGWTYGHHSDNSDLFTPGDPPYAFI